MQYKQHASPQPGSCFPHHGDEREFIYQLAALTNTNLCMGLFILREGDVVPAVGTHPPCSGVPTAEPLPGSHWQEAASLLAWQELQEMHLGGEALCRRKKTGSNT